MTYQDTLLWIRLTSARDALRLIPAAGQSRVQVLWQRFLRAGPWMVQAALAANSAWLTHQLLSPQPTFAGARGWDWMAARITEDHLALITAQVTTIAVCGLISDNRHVRAFAALISSLLTGLIARGFYESNLAAGIAGTGSGTYVILTLLSYWLLANRLFVRG